MDDFYNEDRQLDINLDHPYTFPADDQNNTNGDRVIFSKCSWSAEIPWNFMEPGISLTIRDGAGREGRIAATDFEFGPPADIILQSLNIGILTDPDRNSYPHCPALIGADDKEATGWGEIANNGLFTFIFPHH